MGLPARYSCRRLTSPSSPAPMSASMPLSCSHSSVRSPSGERFSTRSMRFEKSHRRSRRRQPSSPSMRAMALLLRMSSRSAGSSPKPRMCDNSWCDSSSLVRVRATSRSGGTTRRALWTKPRCASRRQDCAREGKNAEWEMRQTGRAVVSACASWASLRVKVSPSTPNPPQPQEKKKKYVVCVCVCF